MLRVTGGRKRVGVESWHPHFTSCAIKNAVNGIKDSFLDSGCESTDTLPNTELNRC